jgi:hypothetical protein
MTNHEKDKIKRFGENIPPNLVEWWNEIVDILNKYAGDIQESSIEMENFELSYKMRDMVRNVLVFKSWLIAGKIDTEQGVNNMVNFIINKAKNDRKSI